MITTCVNHLTVEGKGMAVRTFMNMTTRKQTEDYLTVMERSSEKANQSRSGSRFFP